MKPINSSELLSKLRAKSLFLLDQIENIGNHTPMELLEMNDGMGRWNTLQVLEHLNTYYRYYLPRIETLLEKSATGPNQYFKPGFLGNYFTRTMQPRNGRVANKMKAMKNHSPSPELDGRLVISEFLQWQRKLGLLIERSENVNLNKIRVPISIAPFIKLKLGDVFAFIVAHNNRHWVQIENLLERYPVTLTL
ncbi:DinB family protein [Flavihumibacter stibioxidans]|uniref:DinB-like domain-containing protein n=1 Tax=Flavihumibacter stibioxidans TaxID=1834163 RepID=A0ABR7M776_9BACT|nr:DinB family protein [Flavihumibacter stibioxidans]MBC6490478.1 hypothetical protein [Flavihumibacter stibioxidans]